MWKELASRSRETMTPIISSVGPGPYFFFSASCREVYNINAGDRFLVEVEGARVKFTQSPEGKHFVRGGRQLSICSTTLRELVGKGRWRVEKPGRMKCSFWIDTSRYVSVIA